MLDVSILIKTLNEASNIERCIRSCLAALEGLSGEIVVADSLSDDETVAIASRFPVRIVQLANRCDRGCGVAAQLGYQHARGRYLYIIDADMELPAGFLREAIQMLDKDHSVAGVAGQFEEMLPETDLARIRKGRRKHAHAGVGPVEALNGGGLYRRSAIEQAGGYLTHPSLHAHEELELALRLRAIGKQVVRLPTVSMRHRGHADDAFSLLGRRWRTGYAFGSGEFIRAAIGKPYFSKVLRQFPFHFVAWAWWVAIVAALFALPFTFWPIAAVTTASAMIVVGMMAVKRSAFLGLYSIVGWHVFAAGAIVGMLRYRKGSPARPIAYVDRAPASAPCGSRSIDEAPSGPGSETTMASDMSSTRGQALSPSPAKDTLNPHGRTAVRRGLLHFMSGRLYTGFVQLLLVALYVRYMVVEEYAAYATLTAMSGLIASLTMIGLERAAMRYYPEARLAGGITGLKQVVTTLTLVRLAIVLLAAAVIALLANPVLRLLQLESFEPALWASLIYMLAMSSTRYQRYTMQSLMLQRELTQGLVYPMTLRLVVVVLLIWHFGHFNALWGIAAMAMTEWIQAGMQLRSYAAHLRALERSTVGQPDTWRPNYREIAKYALVNGYSSILRQASGKNTLRLIGATYLSPPAIAAFGFFQALGERIRAYLPVFLARTLIEPVAMANYLADRDFSKLNRVITVALKLNLLVIAPLAVWLAVSGAPAVAVLTGGKFLEYLWISVMVLVTLVSTSHWALLELAANAVSQNMLLAKGSTIAAVATLALLGVTQPWAGVFGLVLAALVTTVIGNVFVMWRLKAAGFEYRLDFLGNLRIFFNAAVAGGAAYGLQVVTGTTEALIGSLAALVVTVLVFSGLCLIIRPFPGPEWDILRKLLPRRLARLGRASETKRGAS